MQTTWDAHQRGDARGDDDAAAGGRACDAGARYIEISLDSVHPEKHGRVSGAAGMWHRTVRGMRYVVQQPGLRLGIAMCVHQGNFAEVEDMLHFAVDIGASCIAHFNFIRLAADWRWWRGTLRRRSASGCCGR